MHVRLLVLRLPYVGLAAGVLAFAGCSSDESPEIPPASVSPEPIPMQFVDWTAEALPDAGEPEGRLAAIADLDKDGHPDIVHPAKEGLRIFWNTGDGTFEAAAAGVVPALDEGFTNQVLVADFDGDKSPDLFLLNTEGASLSLLLNKGSRSFKPATAPFDEPVLPVSGAAVDLDDDNDIDVIVTLAASQPEEGPAVPARALLLINDGDAHFTDETAKRIGAPGLEPFGVAVGDIDASGAPDLFFTGDQVPNRLLLNDGSGVFRDGPPDAIPPGDKPRGRLPVMGDFDGDGALDIFLPSASANVLLLNDGDGRFSDETPFVLGAQPGTGYSAVAMDLDQDLATDLVVANPSGPFALLRNDGSGRLFDYSGGVVPVPPPDSDSISVAAGDLDADGDIDLFVSRGALAAPWLLKNWQPDDLDDGDGDSVPDSLDNCPAEPNPDQANADAHHFNCQGGTQCKAKTGCELALFKGTKAYLLCPTASTWEDARTFCKSLGADLAVVDNAAENTWLGEQAIDSPWIGLSDTATEGAFLWVNGSKLGTGYWNTDEPNDSGGAEDCVGMFTTGESAGKWNDFDCSAEHTFICEDTSVRNPPDPGDACDVCPAVYDPAQKDTDDDGTGDLCQTEE